MKAETIYSMKEENRNRPKKNKKSKRLRRRKKDWPRIMLSSTMAKITTQT